MTTALDFARDSQSAITFAPGFTDERYSASLTTSSDTTLTVPGSGINYMAIFTYESGAEVWVAVDATAAIPAGATFASSTSVQNPVARKVSSGDVLHFITSDSNISVGVEFYAI